MFNIKNTDLEVIKKLGEGSFGAVFLCNWKPKNRRVALKKLLGNMMSSHIDGFFREATLMTGTHCQTLPSPYKTFYKAHYLIIGCVFQN